MNMGEKRKWMYYIIMQMEYLKQNIAQDAFIIMFIQSMERHMRYAIYGEEVAVILGVIGKKQLQKGDGQTQIGGNSNKLVTLTNGKGCNMVDFNTYQGWIQKYINNHDTREINFQNDVVKRLLEQLYPLYDIVCVDTKGGNSKLHDYYMYF